VSGKEREWAGAGNCKLDRIPMGKGEKVRNSEQREKHKSSSRGAQWHCTWQLKDTQKVAVMGTDRH
jgi:hypothetical protein